MIESEIWTTVADCTGRSDWIGVLAMADALQELGQDNYAAGLRWCIRKGQALEIDTSRNYGRLVTATVLDKKWYSGWKKELAPEIIRAYQWMIETRAMLLAELTDDDY